MGTVDHVAAVVKDLDAATRLLMNAFGFHSESAGENSTLGIKFAFLEGENVKIELIQPVAKGPYWELLQKGAVGLNHVAISVDDVEGAINRLSKIGVRSDKPFVAPRGTIANLDPATTSGIRIQLFKKK